MTKINPTGDNIAFIYPDYETALVGKFRSGVMEAAWKTKVIGERCNANGIKEVLFEDPDLSLEPMFYRKAAKWDFVSKYEKQHNAFSALHRIVASLCLSPQLFKQVTCRVKVIITAHTTVLLRVSTF